MKMHSNTIFITGGGSGIGKGLAEAFHKLGNQVIIGGRREESLKSVCTANPGMSYVAADVTDPANIRAVTQQVIAKFPDLNCVINNAGVQRMHDFAADAPLNENALKEEIETNLLGVIRVSAELLPHLRKKKDAVLINVSSGLAFVPLARFPVYCATKAALHSFCISLRHQLKSTGVKVIELIPPYVSTDLNNRHRPAVAAAGGPVPMPLEEFIAEAMKELATDADEAAVGQAKRMQAATASQAMRELFVGMNR